MEKVINRIKNIRQERGFSHEYMGHLLNMSQAAYSKIEKQETKLTIERLYKIAEILETSVVDLLEVNPSNVYNQTQSENKENDNVTFIGHQEVENLYQENKDKTEKIEQLYQVIIKEKDETIAVLKKIIEEKK